MRAAGLTHGGFYRQFKSKEDLVVQAVKRAFNEMSADYPPDYLRATRSSRPSCATMSRTTTETIRDTDAVSPRSPQTRHGVRIGASIIFRQHSQQLYCAAHHARAWKRRECQTKYSDRSSRRDGRIGDRVQSCPRPDISTEILDTVSNDLVAGIERLLLPEKCSRNTFKRCSATIWVNGRIASPTNVPRGRCCCLM